MSDPFLTPSTKVNSKWATKLNGTAKTIKLIKENIRVNLCDLEPDNGYLDICNNKSLSNKRKITYISLILKPFVH
jgi:hypothetical protein